LVRKVAGLARHTTGAAGYIPVRGERVDISMIM
jgi:hypothetical protein